MFSGFSSGQAGGASNFSSLLGSPPLPLQVAPTHQHEPNKRIHRAVNGIHGSWNGCNCISAASMQLGAPSHCLQTSIRMQCVQRWMTGSSFRVSLSSFNRGNNLHPCLIHVPSRSLNEESVRQAVEVTVRSHSYKSCTIETLLISDRNYHADFRAASHPRSLSPFRL